MQVSAPDRDATLIEASTRGDRAAFAELIERYQRAVYAVSYSGVRDRALADDITQQVEAACEMGSWSLELRQCFAAATNITALEACITPADAS